MLLSYQTVNEMIRIEQDMLIYCLNYDQMRYIRDRAYRVYEDYPGFKCSSKDSFMEVYGCKLSFRSWTSRSENWKGFRGVILLHPSITSTINTQKGFDAVDEMQFHTQRILDHVSTEPRTT